MGQVNVEIGGRTYSLSCRDGDEGHLSALAAGIAAKADGLTRSLGVMTEARLLLMASLMVADELHEIRTGGVAPVSTPVSEGASAIADEAAQARLDSLIARVESLADRLG